VPKWIQHPITNELVPASEYRPPSEERHFYAQGDYEPVKMPDGSVITCRGKMRKAMKDGNMTNTQDYSPEYTEKKNRERLSSMRGESAAQDKERRQSLHRILGEYGYGD